MADQTTPPAVPVITGVATAITAFVGRTPMGPTAPLHCASFADFARNFGGLTANYPLTSTVADFFQNGGADAVVVRIAKEGGALGPDDLIGRADRRTGLYALDQVDLFNLLCIPPDRDDFSDADLVRVYQSAAAYCLRRRAMLIADPPRKWSVAAQAGKFEQILPADLGIAMSDAANCAVYFPGIKKLDAGGVEKVFPASGAIAGVFAASDMQIGVWKAPAGIMAAVAGITGLELELSDAQNGLLNALGINCLRSFPIYGPVVWGARTLRGAEGLADDYKYIPARRLALYIEESLYRGTQFAVFEPNDAPLWAKLRGGVSNFMIALWRQGGLLGATPDQACFVQCDQTTTTPADIANGIVNIVVGFAPEKPAEFVIIRIQQMASDAAATTRLEP
jgi:hypothetical protein